VWRSVVPSSYNVTSDRAWFVWFCMQLVSFKHGTCVLLHEFCVPLPNYNIFIKPRTLFCYSLILELFLSICGLFFQLFRDISIKCWFTKKKISPAVKCVGPLGKRPTQTDKEGGHWSKPVHSPTQTVQNITYLIPKCVEPLEMPLWYFAGQRDAIAVVCSESKRKVLLFCPGTGKLSIHQAKYMKARS
jgi:hypothetical protein